ncbi:MAG TPA: GrpB family protein [Candidatus Dormibacteraeota bacterium]|jgi:GrpB-like predicted nucleotidyltransferase (UPF0157 family)|nr:GrpB family protein [Candidatus Dormibacteraeota bacterium]
MEVVVVDHDPRWADLFESEAERLASVMGDNLLHIFHIGSTSVPGLRAKPIIDIMPVVRDLAQVDTCAHAFEGIGYRVLGECGVPGRKYMRKGDDVRTHHVHIYQYDDCANIVRDLAFRDYLRSHPAIAAWYGELKGDLALRYPEDYEGYCNAKEPFVERLSRDALQWYWKTHAA